QSQVFILDENGVTAIRELDNGKLAIGSLSNVTIVAGTIDSEASLAQAVQKIESDHGAIDGVIHAARDIRPEELTLVSLMPEEVIEKHFCNKPMGVHNLDRVFNDRPPGFIAVFSSLASFLGGVFYGAYAAASSLMDSLVQHHVTTETRWLVLDLDRIRPEEEWIQKEELIEIFQRSLAYGRTHQLLVSRRDLEAESIQQNKKETQNKAKASLNRKHLNSSFRAPESDSEKRIIELFEGLFGMDGIGVEDDFFELGGDSLKGIPLINKINKEFSIQITLTDFFNNPTVELLALLIDNRKWLASTPKTKNEILI
ncbi:MAG: KR domain-containing protein, partial [Bacteroidota bacterium]